MECKAIACETLASTRGYCTKCYDRRRNHGHYGRVDASAVFAHVKALRDAGWMWREIDSASCTGQVAYQVFTGRTKTVLRENAAKILAVPVTPRRWLVPVIGVRRRVEALACMGWSLHMVADMAGVSTRTVCPPPGKAMVTVGALEKVEAVYARVASAKGPSAAVAKRAAKRGYLPPIAWDYVDIDDPAAKPFGGFARSA